MHYIGVGRRFAATVIDVIILFVVMYVIALATGGTTSSGFALSGAPAFLGFAVWALYFIGLEATLGATLGKMAVGIRVVLLDGSPIGCGPAVVRNMLRIVDGLFAYLVGAILIWRSPLRQRLGDRVAGTDVISRATQLVPSSASLAS